MSGMTRKERLAHIIDCAEKHFGAAVQNVTAPGGEGRASYRLTVGGQSVIATLRPNFRRTHLEAHVLTALASHCDDIPRCLGVVDKVMFQADVGGHRLNVAMDALPPKSQMDRAAEAVAAIFRIQSAARKTDLHDVMPHLGDTPLWVDNLVDAIAALPPYAGRDLGAIDRQVLADRLATPCVQFVKWDCRAGNAAIDDAGKLRWFDFEYSGLRHGAEDFAWLIGDESWPIGPEEMFAIVAEAFDPDCGHEREAYLDYLALYTTLHAVQRFKLIVKEAQKRGWLPKARVLKYDDAGVHPEFAANICRVGSYCADRNAETRPLVPLFDACAASFAAMLRGDGHKVANG